MKNTILFLIYLFTVTISYSQEYKNSKDTFTYEDIKILKQNKNTINLTGGDVLSKTNNSFNITNSPNEEGETPGFLSVSPSGAAIYEIPINVPDGINGIKPEIALAYNSQNGNGIAGYGWNIKGLSSITRVSATKYHDNEIDGVDLNASDRFALDGQRLILKNGTYGADGAVYETEQYSNLKIVSHSSYGGIVTSPEYFTIYYPDGSIANYGANGSVSYPITSWQDSQGATINYEYYSFGSAKSIRRITYGSLNSSVPTHKVEFDYKAVSNHRRWETGYIGGLILRKQVVIENINIFSNNSLFKKYELTHGTSQLNYYRLHYIKELNGDGTQSRSPIKINYSTSLPAVNVNDITTDLGVINIEQRNAEVVSMDLTGNGKMDFLVYPKNNKTKFWLFKDLESSNTNHPSTISTGGAFEAIFPVQAINSVNKKFSGQTLGIIQKESNTSNTVNFKIYSNGTVNPIYYQYSKAWSIPTYTYQHSLTSSSQYAIPQEYVSGDFNGDGLTDVIAIGKTYTNKYCYEYECPDNGGLDNGDDPWSDRVRKQKDESDEDFKLRQSKLSEKLIPGGGVGNSGICSRCDTYTAYNRGVHFINLKQDVTSGYVQNSGNLIKHIGINDQIITGDYNGDGKTDIMHITNGNLYVYTLDANNQITLLWERTSPSIKADMYCLVGDYNGDGKTDFITPSAPNSNVFNEYISTGIKFMGYTTTLPFTYKNNMWNSNNGTRTGYNLVALDINGDGKTDFLEYNTTTYDNSSNGIQIVKAYNNMGITGSLNGSNSFPKFEYIGSASKTGNLKHYPIPVFLNSNQRNKNLEFASISNKWVTNFSFTLDHREDTLIRSIENKGVTYNISYKNLDPEESVSDYNMNSVYQTDYDEVYPNVNLHISPGTKIVSSLERSSHNSSDVLTKEFQYQGAVYNLQGKGFLGFKGFAETNWHKGLSNIIYNVTKYDPHLSGAVIAKYSMANYFIFNIPTTNYITKTTNTYTSTLSSNKVFKLSLQNSLIQNSLGGFNTLTSYVYDSYNNPIKIINSFNSYGMKIKDITYANSTGTNYYIGRLTSEINTSTIATDTFNSEIQYIYSGNLLTEKKTKGNGTPFDSELYEYDVFGNITKKTITPNGSTSRELNFEYDSTGQFLIKTTDIEGLETTYNFDTITRTLTNKTNSYGQTTNYEYDHWYRPTKVTDYLGNESITDYNENSSYTYQIDNTTNDGSFVQMFYDPLKRLIKKTNKNISGELVSIDYEYDEYDRIKKTSEPYIGSSPTQWNETTYDFYSRPISQTLHSGKVINISYNGLETTVNDGVKTVTTVNNSMGNTLSVTDSGGTIDYTYYGNGNLKTANNSGVVVTTEQDGWGRKTKLTDPSAGVYEYAYNGFGELTNTTTPKGTTEYLYSPTGKLLEKNITGDNTNMAIQYTYNPTHKLLTGITQTDTSGNSNSYAYTYDSNMRIINATENNAFAQFSKTYTYDTFGRIATEDYFAQLQVNGKTSLKKTKKNYQNGSLKSIQDFNTNENLWSVDAINARGQVTTALMGNNMVTNRSYDTFGYLTTNVVTNNSSTPTILMQLNTSFDAQKGTLDNRTNSMFSWSETFGYDDLDRLISFNDNNGNNNHTYDTLGRITENNVVGNYNYSGIAYQVDTIDLNNQGDLYYQQNRLEQVTFNAFKKPFEIDEDGTEKIGFQYNAFNGRSHMFYGDTNTDVLLRNNRKHYSADGSMEISTDNTTGKTTFITYIGGDAYSAPAIWRSEQGTTIDEDYYYLHRDYLGSIMMISDKDGNIKEKRHFDAWGNTVKLTDGNDFALEKFVYLDRGYTGHEHLQGVKLIHMNGRLYDPKLRRFLSPDNYIQDISNTQNFNRYSYVLNNPLRYTDPSGETYTGDGGSESGLSNAQQAGIGALIASLFTNDWGATGNWFDKNWNSADRDIGRAINDIRSWVKGWFKKSRPQKAIVEYDNYASLNNDPLAGSTASTPISYFAGGGSDGLGIGEAITKVIHFRNGFAVGVIDGGASSIEFVKSLATQKGWQNLAQEYMDLAEMSNPMSVKGFMLKAQMADAAGKYIEKLPSMSAYEMGHDLGFASEKVAEAVLLSKGAGFGVNVARNGLGNAMWKSGAFGRKSTLFGRYNSKFVPDGRRGLLNKGMKSGVGWSNKGSQHAFRFKLFGYKLNWLDIIKK